MRPRSVRLSLLLCLAVILASTARSETRFAAAPGPDPNAPALVNVYTLAPTLQTTITAYGSRYGANLAFGDVDGNAKDEVLTGPGPVLAYGPHVRAFRTDGSALPKVSFYAYGTLNYGVNVSGNDIDLPAAQPLGVRDEIITGPGPGGVFGPHVRGFKLEPTGLQAMSKVSFYAYNTLRYGVNVERGDFDADLHEEILTTPGPSLAFTNHVKGFTYRTGQIQTLFSLDLGAYPGNAAGGDVDGDGYAELLTAPGPWNVFGPQIRGYNWDNTAWTPISKINFYAYSALRYGAELACGSLDADRYDEILVGAGPGPTLQALVKGFNYDSSAIVNTLNLIPFFYFYGAKPAVSDSSYEFRPGFLWGTATAAHQVEGGNTGNDWYEWEQLGNAPPSGAACEEYTRYDQDFSLSQSLSHNVHRLSIEWSRIEPARDVYDNGEIAHYHQVLASLRARGLEPMVTLHHFTSPIWVQSPANPASDLDGWLSQATEDEFVEFAAFCAQEYGGEVDLWVTLNEPVGLVFFGYILPAFPPGNFFDIPGAQTAAEHLIFAHARAYDAIHASDTVDANGDGVPASVSIAQHTRWFLPANPSDPNDVFAANHFRYLANDLFYIAIVDGMLDRDWDKAYTSAGEGFRPELAGRADWVGVNYYGTYVVTYNASLPPLWGLPQENPDPSVPKTECGTEIYPQGLFRVIEGYHRSFGLPMIVTENGLCDSDDDQRTDYITEHLRAMLRAEAWGASVMGYCHWSLVDNYEWVSGYGPKFGLIEVDFANQNRTIRPSATEYQAIIQANTVP